MNKKWRVMALAAVIAFVLTLSLNAQDKPGPESSKSAATQGNFGTEVDDFMDVHNWDGVLGDSEWFAYGGYGDYLQLGYARTFGGIYASAFYGGNIVDFDNSDSSEKDVTYGGDGKPSTKVTTVRYGREETYTYNNIDVLVGFSNMGITVGFFERIWAGKPSSPFTKTETVGTNTVQYKDERISAEAQSGLLLPSIGWGMTLPLGGLTVKPYVDVAIGFGQDYREEKTKTYNKVSGAVVGAKTTNISGYRNNSVIPAFTVGADLDLSDNLGVGLEYCIGFGVYSNDYDVAGQSGTVKGSVSYYNSKQEATKGPAAFEYTDTADLSFDEKFSVGHEILPSVWYANAVGDLEFGFSFELPFHIGTFSSKERNETTEITKKGPHNGDPADRTTYTKVTKNTGDTVDESTFEMKPKFTAGITYPLVRDRLAVNAGVGVNIPALYYKTTTTKPGGFETTTEKTVNGKGEVTSPYSVTVTRSSQTDEVESTTRWSGLSAELSAGFTFSFNRNFSVDLLAATTVGRQKGRASGTGTLTVPSGGGGGGTTTYPVTLDSDIELEDEYHAPFDLNTSRFSVIFTIKK
jgi:hypothetical protein